MEAFQIASVQQSSTMKRGGAGTQEGGSDAKKRRVGYATFQKWQRELDREYQTMSWLDCSSEYKSEKKVVTRLKCKVCSDFVERIRTGKNFSDKWIVGANSVRVSNVRDHVQSDQHAHAMMLLKKQRAKSAGLPPSSYAPLAQAFNRLSGDERGKLRFKFDIAHFVAIEKLPFIKYPQICELESHHGVNLGTSYTNEYAGREMIHFIAESRRQESREKLAKAKFFSLLLDGSTDTANIDNELILAVWCDRDGGDERIHTRMEYFTVVRPQAVTAEGLFQVLETALQGLGIKEVSAETCLKLVGIGTDGAAANIAAAGLKGLVEGRLSWVFWMWCMAHRLELAIKDALKPTAFALVDELLLRLYYLYEKSPKRCRELEDIISDLKACFSFDDAGVKPVRASGSRWVTHKQNAMKRVISKFGAYTNHLAALSEDKSVRPADRAKLKGYYSKWTDAKYLFGCALFIDLLSPCTTFSKCMQSDEVDILGALNALLKTLRETEKLAAKPLDQWPTYAATLAKCTCEEGDTVYQCQKLQRYPEALSYYSSKYKEYCSAVSEHIKSRLSWSDLQLMRDIIFVLSSHGWEKAVEEEDDLAAIDRIVERFATPLLGAEADTNAIKGEFANMIEYAVQYMAIATLDYHSVWWRLFHAPNSAEWSNVLILAELLFSLPASNGKLERVFSTLATIKTDKRSRLNNESLDDLLLLNSTRIPITSFDPDPSIDLWWSAKARRPSQRERKEYRPRSSDLPGPSTSRDIEEDSESEAEYMLECWDELFDSD